MKKTKPNNNFKENAGNSKSMSKKLIAYMFALVAIVLLLMSFGLFILGQFSNTKQRAIKTLRFQADVFEKQILSQIEDMAVIGVRMSGDASYFLDRYLAERHMSFQDLKASDKNIASIQEAMVKILQQKMHETSCSGAFITLDTTVYKSNDGGHGNTGTGVYIKRNSFDYSDNDFFLYRGLAEPAKKNGIMPHRKWRLEFDTDYFPNYSELIKNAKLPLTDAFRLTDVFKLRGTSEKAFLFTMPVIGCDGTVYGLCGFEINNSFLRLKFSQPALFEHAVFTLNKGSEAVIDEHACLSCGTSNGYYMPPSGEFSATPFGNGLTLFKNDKASFIGLSKNTSLCKGAINLSLTVLMPKADYDNRVKNEAARLAFLIILVLASTVGISYFFTHRFLMPILKVIKQIKQKEYDYSSEISEIDELLEFLSEQNRITQSQVTELNEQNTKMLSAIDKIKSEKNEAEKLISRLAYSRKDEVDPYDYEQFIKRINTLTPMENKIFNYYIDGKTVKEIMVLEDIKESTVRFHNRNLYSKLGVNSLKQLLLYSAIMKRDKEVGHKTNQNND